MTIGSSNIGSQPKDLKRSIATIKAKYGWETVTHILMADGGAVLNIGVHNNYCRLNEQLIALGEKLVIGWWGQIEKGGTDIDEIDPATAIQRISFSKFEQIAKSQNDLLRRFFRQFRPKKGRANPQPLRTVDKNAIEYTTTQEHRQLLEQAMFLASR